MNGLYDRDAAIELSEKHVLTDDVCAVELTLWLNEFDYYTATGTSRRDPQDPVDREVGVKLATGRAFRKLGRELLKDGHMIVSEHDRVRKAQQAAAAKAHAKKEARTAEIKKNTTTRIVGY